MSPDHRPGAVMQHCRPLINRLSPDCVGSSSSCCRRCPALCNDVPGAHGILCASPDRRPAGSAAHWLPAHVVWEPASQPCKSPMSCCAEQRLPAGCAFNGATLVLTVQRLHVVTDAKDCGRAMLQHAYQLIVPGNLPQLGASRDQLKAQHGMPASGEGCFSPFSAAAAQPCKPRWLHPKH